MRAGTVELLGLLLLVALLALLVALAFALAFALATSPLSGLAGAFALSLAFSVKGGDVHGNWCVGSVARGFDEVEDDPSDLGVGLDVTGVEVTVLLHTERRHVNDDADLHVLVKGLLEPGLVVSDVAFPLLDRLSGAADVVRLLRL